MPAYNTSFELSVEDLELIEDALRVTKQDCAKEAPQDGRVRKIHDLLGRLHNQKVFYRPRKGAFVSG